MKLALLAVDRDTEPGGLGNGPDALGNGKPTSLAGLTLAEMRPHRAYSMWVEEIEARSAARPLHLAFD